jgi:hypothetical protein
MDSSFSEKVLKWKSLHEPKNKENNNIFNTHTNGGYYWMRDEVLLASQFPHRTQVLGIHT